MAQKIFIFLGLLFLLLVFVFPAFTYAYFSADLSDKTRLVNNNDTGITLLDSDSKPFFTFYKAGALEYIPLSQISRSTQNAVIAAEDKNFYSNPGFSLSGMARALYADLKTGSLNQGGSTITQELVKNDLLDSQKSLFRKYQEIVLASDLTKIYSKQDILEMYLNSVYFGEGSFGIEEASQTYFGIPSNQLDLAQSSLLAGLLPAPSALSPLSNDPQKSLDKQKYVLSEMVKDGYITQAQANSAESEKLTFNQQNNNLNSLAPHFAYYVRDLLIKKYGEESVIRSGYTVQTTLNSSWQEYAQNIVKNQVAILKKDNASNGSAVVIDPKTGEIKVMVGSEDWNNPDFGQMNMAISPRQPGSSFKPIVYSKAFADRLITPATILQDVPTIFPGGYKPHDYDYKYRGPVTVRRALANSLNIPAVEVMQKVGVSNGLDQANGLGITTLSNDPSQYGLSLVLGAGEVSLLDLTNVYATFANAGVYNTPTAIINIKDKYNNTIYSYSPQPQTVLDSGVTYLISSILSDNSARQEEFGNALTISRSAAVKTGTTENFRDALTLGYTPSLVVGVWVGNNNNAAMDNIAGSLGAAPIWKSLMEHYLTDTPVENFTLPSDIKTQVVCPYQGTDNNLSGLLVTEYFLSGTAPSTSCNALSPFPSSESTPSSEIPAPSSIPNPAFPGNGRARGRGPSFFIPTPQDNTVPVITPLPSVPIVAPTPDTFQQLPQSSPQVITIPPPPSF